MCPGVEIIDWFWFFLVLFWIADYQEQRIKLSTRVTSELDITIVEAWQAEGSLEFHPSLKLPRVRDRWRCWIFLPSLRKSIRGFFKDDERGRSAHGIKSWMGWQLRGSFRHPTSSRVWGLFISFFPEWTRTFCWYKTPRGSHQLPIKFLCHSSTFFIKFFSSQPLIVSAS